MPDAIGFWLATALLATVFTIFGVVGRIVDGVVSEIRLTVAPTVVAGVRAWGEEARDARSQATQADDPAAGEAGRPGPSGVRDPDHGTHRATAVEIPVQRVPVRGWLRSLARA